MEWITKEIEANMSKVEENLELIGQLKKQIKELTADNKALLKDVESYKNLLVISKES